ncbi:MAG: hypothetical protein IJN39_05880, partial [Clostridia bacterium]|nr:hypothetical protein [Clostridia bacterium]
YREFEEDMVVVLSHKGEDMNHDLMIAVDGDRQVIKVLEKLPFEMNPEKAVDIACAVCYANHYLVLGKFTYDMDKTLRFEIAQAYEGSLISIETIKHMVVAFVATVEEYDDKFMALNKGYLSYKDFAD